MAGPEPSVALRFLSADRRNVDRERRLQCPAERDEHSEIRPAQLTVRRERDQFEQVALPGEPARGGGSEAVTHSTGQDQYWQVDPVDVRVDSPALYERPGVESSVADHDIRSKHAEPCGDGHSERC